MADAAHCKVPGGDVVLSHEHDGARWIAPVDYRERYLTGEVIDQFAASDPRLATMIENIRAAVDAYIAWRR